MLHLVLAPAAWWLNRAATFTALLRLVRMPEGDLGANWEWEDAA